MAGVMRVVGKALSRAGFTPGTSRQVRRMSGRVINAKGAIQQRVMTQGLSPATVKSASHQTARVAKVNKMVKRINTQRAAVGLTLGSGVTGGAIYGLHRRGKRS